MTRVVACVLLLLKRRDPPRSKLDRRSAAPNVNKRQREERLDGATPTEALENFPRLHLRFHSERPDEVFIAYMELRNLTPENFAQIEELRRSYEDGLEAILRAGIDSGDFEVSDPKIATMAVIAMLTGVNTWFREGGRLSLAEVEQIYWDMVRKAVGV